MSRRVVVTGVGVVSSIGANLADFTAALRAGRSGVRRNQAMVDHAFACHVAAVPDGIDELAAARFDAELLLAMNSGHRLTALAAVDAWADAGLTRRAGDDDRVDWDAGAVVATGVGGLDPARDRVVPMTTAGKVRRLGSTAVEQVMASGVSARVSGLLALGNQVTTNSAACSTGTEAIIMGLERIRTGRAERMLCGGAEGASHFIWAGFDAMRVLCKSFNDAPERASRPMSATAGGFVPGAGAALLVLESLDSARARGARIRAEVKGGFVNCGGHRMGGSMTAPNRTAVRRCIQGALADAGIGATEVGVISGHLTATGADAGEVTAWAEALGCAPERLPPITATKSLIGHTLGAAGAIEAVAAVAMLEGGFVHPSVNCDDVHPEIAPYAASIPHQLRELPELRTVVKSSFGFGDVNACLVLARWRD